MYIPRKTLSITEKYQSADDKEHLLAVVTKFTMAESVFKQ